MARAYTRHDWERLDPLIDRLIQEEGYTVEQACKDLGIKLSTYRMHQRTRESGTPEGHPNTPQEPDSASADQYTMEHLGIPHTPDTSEEHPGTPEAHQDMSLQHLGVLSEHSGVPARQLWPESTPTVHPGTPTAEDWELWTIIKARWQEIEKMLSERQVMLSTPIGTPGHTQKKTYVFDVRP
jgi:hypothetical protein